MAGKKLKLHKFRKNVVQLKEQDLQNIKGGINKIPTAEESTGIISWDNIDVRSTNFRLDNFTQVVFLKNRP